MIYSSCIVLGLIVALVVHHAAEAYPHHQNERSVELLTGAAALVAAVAGKTEPRQRRSPAETELDFEIDDDMIITAATLDDSGCGARMLCELTQKGPEQLEGSLPRKLVAVFE